MNTNKKAYIPITILCMLLFSSYPYVFNRLINIPSDQIIFLFAGIFSIIGIINRRKQIVINKYLFVIVFVQIVFWTFMLFYHNDYSYLTRLLICSLSVLLLIFIDSYKGGIFASLKSMNYIVLIQVILGLFAFFLILFDILHPYIEFKNIDDRDAYCYILTCSNAVYGNIIRIAGYFDEPGALAFWGIFALLFNKLFFKNTAFEVFLIIGLIFTFSMAFYIQLILYYFLFNLKKFKYGLAFGTIIILFITISNLSKGTDWDFYGRTLGRLQYDKENVISGNNREIMMIKAKKCFINSPLLGMGAEKIEKADYMNDNPYEILAKDGIFGLIIIYLPLIFLFIKIKDYDVRACIILLLIGYMQRPFHINFMHFFMLYMFFYSVSKYYKQYVANTKN